MPDIRLRQRIVRTDQPGLPTVESIGVPDLFADWVNGGQIGRPSDFREPKSGTHAPGYSVSIDFTEANGSLDESQALASAIVAALGTDRLASVSDTLPDNYSTDRRGWWGDLDARLIWSGWDAGTRLWTMQRDKITGAGARQGSTLAKAESFARECIRPFMDKRIISNFTVEAAQTNKQTIIMKIVLMRARSPAVSLEYGFLWDDIERR